MPSFRRAAFPPDEPPYMWRHRRWHFYVVFPLCMFTLVPMLATLSGHLPAGVFWAWVIFMVIVMSVQHWMWRRLYLRVERSDSRLCLECGYDLRASGEAGICPECGTPFEIAEVRKRWDKYLWRLWTPLFRRKRHVIR
jgi:Na+/melibiose symporter-like transporter